MKKYIKPNLTIFYIQDNDILTASIENDSNFYMGEEVDLWENA